MVGTSALGFRGGWRRADEAKVLGQIVGLAGPALCKLPFEIVRRTLARESDSPWRAAGPASLHSWLCKELRIDFAKEWVPSVEFVELFEGNDRQRLLDEGGFELGASPKPAEIVAGWPADFVPRALLLVDEKGKIPSPKKSKSTKAG